MSVPGQQEEQQDTQRDGAVEIDERRAKMDRLRADGIDPYPPVTPVGGRARAIAEVLAAHDPAGLERGRAPRAALPRSPAG